ncbi:MAG: amidohydrolase, partial [Chloroflexi bacterium]|nr:amidohydrolase [Chloroflexota bacterium]
MAKRANLKSSLSSSINNRADELERIARDILDHPESGYREARTSKLVADWFSSNGMEVQTAIALTGVIGTFDTGKPGPHVAVMGELDSLIVPGHSHADSVTSAAHACGHHAQIGSMLTVAAGIAESSVLNGLSGKISFMAV